MVAGHHVVITMVEFHALPSICGCLCFVFVFVCVCLCLLGLQFVQMTLLPGGLIPGIRWIRLAEMVQE